MIDAATKQKIRHLFFRDHYTIHAIGKSLGVHHGTVKKAINYDSFHPKKEIERRSILDGYSHFIDEHLELYPKITATRLMQILRDRGYSGSISTLRNELRQRRPRLQRAYNRMTVSPGEQGQVDWAHCGSLKVGGAERKLYVFVMVLSYSRAVYAEFCLNMKTATFLRCHERAFEYFSGIPKILLYDNLKSVVLARRGREVRFNPEILDFSGFYHFEPRPCNVYSGNEKGRVERTIRYIRDNYLAARPLTDLRTMNESILQWCGNVANRRHWPEDRSYLVKDRWEKEKAHLFRLCDRRLTPEEQLSTTAKKTPWICFDLNFYSIPPDFIGRPLIISAGDHRVSILCDGSVIAEHQRSYDRNRFVEFSAHRKALTNHSAFGRSSFFKETLVKDFPLIGQILEDQFKCGRDIPALVRSLFRCRYAAGDEVFGGAIKLAVAAERYSIDSVRHFIQQIETGSQAEPHLPLDLPNRPKVRDLEIKPRSLDSYDHL